MKIKNHIIFFLVLMSSVLCFAQNPNKLFTKSELHADFQLLQQELKANHPGLYIYSSQQEVEKAFQTIKASLDQPMSGIDFYRKLIPLNAIIKDAHTQFIIPESFNQLRNTTLPRFPFALHFDGSQLKVKRNLSDNENIQIGWEVLEINKEPFGKLIEEFTAAVSSDGDNVTLPVYKLNYDFSGVYSALKGCPSSFEIKFKDLAGQVQSMNVKALLVKEIVANQKERYPKLKSEKKKPLQLEIKNDIAILTVRTFIGETIKATGQSYEKYFKEAFAKIHAVGANHLIIDIRDNLGGWPEMGDELLSYLISKPFHHAKSDWTVTNKIAHPEYYKRDDYLKHFKRLRFKKSENGYEVFWNEPAVKPKKNNFAGQVYVLSNGFSCSQSGAFAGLLKDKSNTIFIGEEPGGNATQCCAGDMITLVLQNTKVKLILPLRKLSLNVSSKNTGHGVIPDHEIKPTVNDLQEGRDVVMDFTLKLCNQNYAN